MSRNNGDQKMNGQPAEKAIFSSNGHAAREGTPHASTETPCKVEKPMSLPGVANLCGAKSKRTGRPCRNAGLAPSNRCRLHGGLSLRGTQSPSFKHGLYSKFVPKNLRAVYDQVVNDKELYSMREEIAVLKSQEVELMKQLDELWGTKNKDGLKKLTRAWNQLRRIYLERNQLVTAERKHLIDMRATITVETMVLMLTTMVEAVKRIVNDPSVSREEILARVQQETYRLLPPKQVRAEIV
jgi:hypothetical protein